MANNRGDRVVNNALNDAQQAQADREFFNKRNTSKTKLFQDSTIERSNTNTLAPDITSDQPKNFKNNTSNLTSKFDHQNEIQQ